jgi:hypothetical protein
MNEVNLSSDNENLPPREERGSKPEAKAGARSASSHQTLRPRALWLFGLGALLPLAASVAYGASQYNAQDRQVMRTTEQQRDFVPTVRVAKVRAADSAMTVNLPATLAFAAANIFTRANGYIKRAGRYR